MNQRTIILAVASLLLVSGMENSSAANIITISYVNYNTVTSLDTTVLPANSVVWFGSWNVTTNIEMNISNLLSNYLTGQLSSAALASNFTLGLETTYGALGAGDIVDFTLSDEGLIDKKIDMVLWKGSTTALATEVAAIRWDGSVYPDVSTLITGVAIANSLPSIGENYVTALFGSIADTGADGLGTIATTIPLGITSGNPTDAIKDEHYSYTITANNGATSYAVTIASGQTGLPAGLELNTATGVISGTPTVTGSFTFTLTANNPLFVSVNPLFVNVTKVVTLTVNAPVGAPPVISPIGAQTAYRGVPFSLTVSASNDPTGFTLSGHPAGFSISELGVITGATASEARTYTLSIEASGAGGTSRPELVTLTLVGPTITPTQRSVNGDKLAPITPIVLTVVPAESSPSISVGALPDGLTFDSVARTITGAPTAVRTMNTEITATFASGVTATTDIAFQFISPLPILLPPTSAEQEASRGQEFSLILQRANNNAEGTFTYEQVSGVDLSTIGLNLQAQAKEGVAAGTISGKPKKLGVYSASFRAYTESGTSNILPITITVDAVQPVINCELNRGAGLGSPFRHVFTSNDSEQNKTVSGLPPGLTFQRNVRFNQSFYDMISGVPSSPGSFPVTLQASTQKLDGSTISTSSTLTIQVDGSRPNLSSLGVRPCTFRLNQPTHTTYAPAEGFFLTGSDMGASSTIYMNATGLPPGLGFGKKRDGTDGSTTEKTLARRRGLITGTPTQAGVYPITLYVQNGVGYTKSTLVLTVLP